MKKLFCLLTAALMLFSLSACTFGLQGNKTSGSNSSSSDTKTKKYDMDKIESTIDKMLTDINSEDYEWVNKQVKDDLKSEISTEKISELCSPLIKAAGKDKQRISMANANKKSSSGDDYLLVTVKEQYTNYVIEYKIGLNENMDIVEFDVKKA